MADPNPLLPDPSEEDLALPSPAQWIQSQRQDATLSALRGLDDDPDETARALELSQATGVPPGITRANLESEEAKHKAGLTAYLMNNNEYLRNYVRDNPLGASVSNDDWGQLDKISKSLTPIGHASTSIIDKAVKAFGEHFDLVEGLGGAAPIYDPGTNPLARAIHLGLWQPAWRLAYGAIIGLPSEFLQASLAGLNAGLIEAQVQAGLDPEASAQRARELTAIAEARLMRMEGAPHAPEAPKGWWVKNEEGKYDLVPHIKPEEIAKEAQKLDQTIRLSRPYIEANKAPPPGLDPNFDELYKQQAKQDGKAVSDALKEAGKSSTRERSPELFEQFIRQHTGESKIGISGDAVAKLYGDERPSPDDGKLGWVPGIAQQLDLAKTTGADVEVPLSEWLARVEPEVAKELHDNLRVRPGGMTLEEAKEPRAPEEGPVGAPAIYGPMDPGEMEELQGRPANEYKKEIEASYEGALNEQTRLKYRAMVGDTRSFDEWKKVATDEGHSINGRPNAFAAARAYSEKNPNTPAILTSPQEGRRTVFINGERVYREPMDRALRALQFPANEAVRLVSGMLKPIGKVKPALSPQGVVPPNSIVSHMIETMGEKVTSVASFPLKDGLARIKTEGLNDFQALLTEKFASRMQEIVGDTQVHTLDTADFSLLSKKIFGKMMGGWYNPDTNEIFIRSKYLRDPEAGAIMLLHEGGHALTLNRIRADSNLQEIYKTMLQETKDHLRETSPNDLKEFEYLLSNHEEFAVGAYESHDFREMLLTTPVSKELSEALGLKEPNATMWDAFRKTISDIFYWLIGTRLDNNMLDAFLKLQEKFEVKEMPEEGGPVGAPEPEAPEYLKAAFRTGQAFGMDKARLQKYLSLIEKEHQEREDFTRNQAVLKTGQQNTQEWKENLPRVREEVLKTTLAKPDIAADRFLRTRELPDGTKGPSLKLNPELISPELRDGVPKEFLRDDGVSPDSLAGVFGYQSSNELVRALSNLEKERQTAGLTPADHLRQMVTAETQRRMEREFGKSAEDVLHDAKSQVFSPTALDAMHEELAALYERNGRVPITKQMVKDRANELFDRLPIDTLASDKFIRDMGQQAKIVEENLLPEGSPTVALNAKLQQVINGYMISRALKLEKLRDQFDRKVKGWIQRDSNVGGIGSLWIHDILEKVGYQAKRIPGDWERQRQLLVSQKVMPDYHTLSDFVTHVNKMHELYQLDPDGNPEGPIMPVASWLQDDGYFAQNGPKPVNDLTPPEFKELFDSLKAVDKYSREANKIEVRGKKADLNEAVDGLVTRLREAVKNKPTGEGVIAHGMRSIGSLLLTPESWAYRLDVGNAIGPFSQLIVRKIMDGAYKLRDYDREFAKEWNSLGKIGRNTAIENDLFKDPLTGEPLKLRQYNLRAIIANMGNALQRKKLAEGYGLTEDQIWNWLWNVQGITQDHIRWAQKMGDIFSKAFEESEKADIARTGVAPERIELGKISTPWGDMDEWYHPLIRHPVFAAEIKPEELLEENGFRRPAAASGFRKGRTGATYALDLTLDAVPFRLKQILNYAAMVNPLSEVSRVVYHPDFAANFKRFYGTEYYGAMQKWLKDSAGNREWRPSGENAVYEGLRFFQDNATAMLIGMNPGTVIKHNMSAWAASVNDVGKRNFAKSLGQMVWELPTGQDAWHETMEKSEEVRNRFRSMKETIAGQDQQLFRRFDWTGKLFGIRQAIQTVGHFPVAALDLVAANAMWHAAYLKNLRDGMREDDAIASANTMVRRTHGSTILPARAQVQRYDNPVVRAFMPFYNYVNNALNRNYEMLWRSKLAMEGRTLSAMTGFEEEQFKRGFSNVPYILGGMFVFGPLMALSHYLVSPPPKGKDESDAAYWGSVLLAPYMMQLPYVRDAYNHWIDGTDPNIGIYTIPAKALLDMKKKNTWSGEDPGLTFRRANRLFGVATGLTYEPVGKLGEYMFRLEQGKRVPDDFWNPIKGISGPPSGRSRR